MPCVNHTRRLTLPPPGSPRTAFAFHRDRDRDLFLIMPRNHPVAPRAPIDPRIALVGLSPAGTQIEGFLAEYGRSSDYEVAASWASFRGLQADILNMLRGLGVLDILGLNLDGVTTFAGHPEILTNSLVRCASLSADGSSDDFDPTQYESNVRCITHRLFRELTNPAYQRLEVVAIFGRQAAAALKKLRLPTGQTVWSGLQEAGKLVIELPHPSGQNMEYVKLGSLSSADFRQREAYAAEKWETYRLKPARKGRAKESEERYKAKRQRYWDEIAALRNDIAKRAC